MANISFVDDILSGVTGGGLIPSAIHTTDFQAEVGRAERTDTTAGTFTATAPLSPSDGDEFALEDAAEGGSWSLANPLLLVTSDGSTLAGNPGAAGVDHDGGTRALWRYVAATQDWAYLGEAGGTSTGTGSDATVDLLDLGTPVIALFPGMDQTAAAWGHQLGVATAATTVWSGTPELRQDGALRMTQSEFISIGPLNTLLSDQMVVYLDGTFNIDASAGNVAVFDLFDYFTGYGFYLTLTDVLFMDGIEHEVGGTPFAALSGRVRLALHINPATGIWRGVFDRAGVRTYHATSTLPPADPIGQSVEFFLGVGDHANPFTTDYYACVVAKDVPAGLSTAQIDASLSALIDRMSVYGPSSLAIADVSGLQTALDAKAPTSRQILTPTTSSIIGGGDLSADRTLSLEGDVDAPAGARYYGTNAAGTKGYHVLGTGTPNAFDDSVAFSAGRTGEALRSLDTRIQEVINVRDFGTFASGVDHTASINAAIDHANAVRTERPAGPDPLGNGPSVTLWFPPGFLYRSDGLTALESGINVIMESAIVKWSNAYSGVFWQIGNDSHQNRYCTFLIRMRGYPGGGPLNPYTDESYIGLQLFNCCGCIIDLRMVCDFTRQVQMISRTAVGVSGTCFSNRNQVFLGFLHGRYGLDILCDGLGGEDSFHTHSNFYGGGFISSNVPTTLDKAAISFMHVNGGATMHSLSFDAPQMEMGTSATNVSTGFYFPSAEAVGNLHVTNIYSEGMNSLAHYLTTAAPGGVHCYEVLRGDTILRDMELEEPIATATSRASAMVIPTGRTGLTFAGDLTVPHSLWSYNMTLRYTGTGGHTVTIGLKGSGRLAIVNAGSGSPLVFAAAAGATNNTPSTTTLAVGELADIYSYDRGTSFHIYKR